MTSHAARPKVKTEMLWRKGPGRGFGLGVCNIVGVRKMETAMANIAAGSTFPLGSSSDHKAIWLWWLLQAYFLPLLLPVVNCAGVWVLLGLAGHSISEYLILFYSSGCLASSYLVSTRLLARRGEKREVNVWINGWTVRSSSTYMTVK